MAAPSGHFFLSWPRFDGRVKRGVAACLLLGLVLDLTPSMGLAQQAPRIFPQNSQPKRPPEPGPNRKEQVLLRADRMTYDQDNEIISASGNVEISQGPWVLMADSVNYNRRTEIVTAAGNVSLLEPSGEVLFGEYMEMADDFKDVITSNFRALLVDNSRLAAAAATRSGGNQKELSHAVFSPCNLCQEDPSKAPSWQIKATTIIHDEVEHQLIYHNAEIDAFGVPVFWTPYLSHPDPTVKRQTGFLQPSVGTSSTLGVFYDQPWYGVIDESSDVTIEPLFYSKEGNILALEGRKQFLNGNFRVAGSVGNVSEVINNISSDNKANRGNLAATGEWEFDDEFRTGFVITRATDQTYTRALHIPETFQNLPSINGGGSNQSPIQLANSADPNQLNSTFYLEGFQGRNYEVLNAYAFQQLTNIIPQSTLPPLIPAGQYSAYYVPSFLPGYMTTDDRMVGLWRSAGTDSFHLSTLNAYYLPFKTGDGSVFTWATTLQLDSYRVNNEALLDGTTANFNGNTGRVFPQTALKWQYPMVTHNDNRSYLIEPQVQLVGSPRGENSNRIPNEDSQAIILDETNLFALNRYQGRDRVSSGDRVDYGFRASMYGDHSGSAQLFVGQSERLQDDGTYPVGSGLEHNLSNLIGSIHLSPGDWVDFGYKADVNSRTGGMDRSEVAVTLFHWGGSFSTGLQQFASVQYQNVSNAATGATTTVTIPEIKSLSFNANVPFLKYYTANAYYLYDVEHGETQQIQAGILYRDECFGITLQYQRVYYQFQDIVPSNSFVVRFGLKYLGDFGG